MLRLEAQRNAYGAQYRVQQRLSMTRRRPVRKAYSLRLSHSGILPNSHAAPIEHLDVCSHSQVDCQEEATSMRRARVESPNYVYF